MDGTQSTPYEAGGSKQDPINGKRGKDSKPLQEFLEREWKVSGVNMTCAASAGISPRPLISGSADLGAVRISGLSGLTC